MKQLLLFSTLFSHQLFALNICSTSLDHTLPNSDSSVEKILNKLVNREFDPCNLEVKPALSEKELCGKEPEYFQNLLCQKNGKMGFKNKKGLFGLDTGVCWWHSQFHRNATYTTHYAPKEPKLDPSRPEDKKKLKAIINNIVRLKKISKIPGYSSIREFTQDPQIEKLIQKRLQKWMSEDSFLKMQWTKGLKTPNNYSTKSEEFYMQQKGWKLNPNKDFGKDKLNRRAQRALKRKTYKSDEKMSAAKVKTINHQSKEIDKLFKSVVDKKQVGYITLQYPGIMAHAAIVFDAKKSIIDGKDVFEFKVQDSNNQGANKESKWGYTSYSSIKFVDGVWYAKRQKGEFKADLKYYEPINIKVHNTKQLDKISQLYKKQCNKNLF